MMRTLDLAARAFLWLHIIFTAITFGGAIYETMVINSVWYSNLPDSLAFMTNSEYSVQPGRFWRGMGPFPSLAALLAFVLNLPIRRRRWLVTIAFTCMVFNTVTTIFYFVPILMIIFSPDGGGRSSEELTQLALNWKNGTWIRMGMLLLSLVLSIIALGRSAEIRPAGEVSA